MTWRNISEFFDELTERDLDELDRLVGRPSMDPNRLYGRGDVKKTRTAVISGLADDMTKEERKRYWEEWGQEEVAPQT